MIPKPKRLEDKKLLSDMRYMRCSVCGTSPPSDPSHIRTRGSGGPDTVWNVVPKCRRHHIEWGTVGWQTFIERYPDFAIRLHDLGWEDDNGTLWHPGLVNEPVELKVSDCKFDV